MSLIIRVIWFDVDTICDQETYQGYCTAGGWRNENEQYTKIHIGAKEEIYICDKRSFGLLIKI